MCDNEIQFKLYCHCQIKLNVSYIVTDTSSKKVLFTIYSEKTRYQPPDYMVYDTPAEKPQVTKPESCAPPFSLQDDMSVFQREGKAAFDKAVHIPGDRYMFFLTIMHGLLKFNRQ